MYARKRRIYDLNKLRVVPLPNGTPVAQDDMASVAGDRLFLIDPEGELTPEELLKMLKKLEPEVWHRLQRTKSRGAKATP